MFQELLYLNFKTLEQFFYNPLRKSPLAENRWTTNFVFHLLLLWGGISHLHLCFHLNSLSTTHSSFFHFHHGLLTSPETRSKETPSRVSFTLRTKYRTSFFFILSCFMISYLHCIAVHLWRALHEIFQNMDAMYGKQIKNNTIYSSFSTESTTLDIGSVYFFHSAVVFCSTTHLPNWPAFLYLLNACTLQRSGQSIQMSLTTWQNLFLTIWLSEKKI